MAEAQHRGRGQLVGLSSTPATRSQLSDRMRRMLTEGPLSMYEVLRRLEGEDYRSVLQAWGDLRAQVALIPDDRGRYRLPEPREDQGPERGSSLFRAEVPTGEKDG